MTRRKAYSPEQSFQPRVNDDVAFLLGGDEPAAPVAERARERGLPLLHLPLDAIAPDPSQLRRLPHPADLLDMEAQGDSGATELLDGLRALGASLKLHGQLQPAVVYRDADPAHPHATHRLLHGQRRWSAALLANLPTLWVVEVPRPADVERLIRQYEENEQRENFSDIERAWACLSIKEAMQNEAGGEVPWATVEEQVQLSAQRRQDLLRLLRFDRAGQALILRHGWSEWTLRPLHMAIHAGSIPPAAATDLLRHLATLPDVNARIVADLTQQHSTPAAASSASAGKPSRSLAQQMQQVRRTVAKLQAELATVEDADVRAALRAEVAEVQTMLHALLEEL